MRAKKIDQIKALLEPPKQFTAKVGYFPERYRLGEVNKIHWVFEYSTGIKHSNILGVSRESCEIFKKFLLMPDNMPIKITMYEPEIVDYEKGKD